MSPAALGDEYVRFCEGIKGLAGLDLLQYKRDQMERRLRSFAQRMGIAKLSDYLQLLRRDEGELDRFLDRVTINVSQLWRNPEQWEIIGNEVIPQLAATRHLRIWSAGCSYGAECYTITAVSLEHASRVRVEVKGTDIDTRVLARARAGLFSEEDARTVPPASLKRWFEHEDGGWRATPELRKHISFERADLLSMQVPEQAYDLVLCRNVVIYFTEDVRNELHRRLARSLRSGGFLVIGSTERVTGASELALEPTQPFIFRKR
ncbi:MAG TPA: protein-glutamate O-methyltransferase CheR [Solirubrobacteraceae bacterium]|nr:protein-glutamate O-methyltransferase CheR [Solirubrobacteraceae bacterium]